MPDHFYTTNQAESYSAANGGYKFEGVQCFVFLAPSPRTTPEVQKNHIFHRLYNGSNHFYTVDDLEAKNAVGNDGYVIEKMPCFVFPIGSRPPVTVIPLFRAYNRSTNDHFYTTDKAEFNNAILHGGYSPEGDDGCCFVLPVPAPNQPPVPNTGPLFRLYQP
jgi:hypothetical protein